MSELAGGRKARRGEGPVEGMVPEICISIISVQQQHAISELAGRGGDGFHGPWGGAEGV